MEETVFLLIIAGGILRSGIKYTIDYLLNKYEISDRLQINQFTPSPRE